MIILGAEYRISTAEAKEEIKLSTEGEEDTHEY